MVWGEVGNCYLGILRGIKRLIKEFWNSSEGSDEICNRLVYQFIDFL